METNNARKQAKAQLDSIVMLVRDLRIARERNLVSSAERLETELQEDPLSCEVRQDWHPLGEPSKPNEYRILLCTGGPAVQIIGNLDEHSTPDTVRLQYQDWGTPWTNHPLTAKQEEALLAYANEFYWGE